MNNESPLTKVVNILRETKTGRPDQGWPGPSGLLKRILAKKLGILHLPPITTIPQGSWIDWYHPRHMADHFNMKTRLMDESGQSLALCKPVMVEWTMRESRIENMEKRNLWNVVLRCMRCRRGNALVETSMLLPVLVALLIAAYEIAAAVYTSIEVSNAALAGVQYGMQSAATAADTKGIQTAASNDVLNIALGTTTVSHSCICANGSASNCQPKDCSDSANITILTVKTQATFTPVLRMPGIPSSFTMYGQAVQKVMQ